MKLLAVAFALMSVAVGCAKSSPPAEEPFGDDYMIRYASWIRDCTADLEAARGPAPAGSAKREQMVAACDAAWRDANPTP